MVDEIRIDLQTDRFWPRWTFIPLTGTISEAHLREDLAILEFELTTRTCEAAATFL